MQWDDFYEGFGDWSESTVRTRISSLKDIGSGDEVADVVVNLPTEKLKVQLSRKAMRLQVRFDHIDFTYLDGELPDDVFREVADYSGYDADTPDIDTRDIDWDDFCIGYSFWRSDVMISRINALRNFGSAEEVCEVICNLDTPEAADTLYEKAVKFGVRFTEDQLCEMGVGNFLTDICTGQFISQLEADVENLMDSFEQMQQAEAEAVRAQQRQKRWERRFGRLLVFGALVDLFSNHSYKKKRK